MRTINFLPLIGLLPIVICDIVHTYTFHQLSRARGNFSVGRTVTTNNKLISRGEDVDADKARWEKAVCKGAQLLSAMAGDEKRAGNSFKPPRESGESDYQDYSKSLQSIRRHRKSTS